MNSIIHSQFTQLYPRLHKRHALQALRLLEEFIVIDTETTGIGKSAEIIELAIVDYKSLKVLFNSLLRPYRLHLYETSEGAKVNGITSHDLNGAPTLPDVWPEIISALRLKHITAFNADFDIRAIRNSAFKWGLDAPILDATCIMKLVTAWLNLDFWISLEEAANYFGIENGGAHRALPDVMATIDVIKAMKEQRHG